MSEDPKDIRSLEEGPEGGEVVDVGTGELDRLDPLDCPATLPIIPLRNTVLFPMIVSPLLVNTERSRQLVDGVLVSEDRLMLAVAVKDAAVESPGAKDIYSVGTVLRVVKMLKFPDDSYRLLVQGVGRARIDEIRQENPFLEGVVTLLEEEELDSESVSMTALVRNLAQQFSELAAESPRLSDEFQHIAINVEEPSRLADLVAANLDFDVAGKQSLLEELNVEVRLRRVSDEVVRSRDVVRVENEIREKVQSDMGKTQREYMLRQQLEAIRKELGETDDEGSELQRLREAIDESKMPEDAYKQASRELDRIEQIPEASAEHGVIRTYLEWMTELPWAAESEDKLDVNLAREILDEDHYDLVKVKDRIVEYIAVLSLKRDLKGPILCFTGPPGTGKTSLGRSIARALGREFARISLGGVRDEAEVRGHRRTYVGAMPGRILQALRRTKTRNPVILLDEIDKVGADQRGDPSSALLEVLDPEQNNTFSDHYLEVPFDLSKVLFIATANQVDPIPAPLLDRMEVIELPGYTAEEKCEIAKQYLIPRQVEENGLADIDVEFPEKSLFSLIHDYTREAGVRNLEREIGSVCRKLARKVAEEEDGGPFSVSMPLLSEFLGPVRFESELAEHVGAGVSVGLAWTPSGGDILFIEATSMAGKGRLKLTGSLGDVMRESVEAARSWLHSNAEKFDLDPAIFEQTDIHLHVPAGAVPKDGPSAGVAMVTALASLLTGRCAKSFVAMTGEITLRGKVLPVGGVKEKVLAAKRSGIQSVVLPERNRKDLEEIEADLLRGIEFNYVGTIDEALEYTLVETSD
ncbi:MAG: endopeptidase La [Deltaproteobacteria bacterium]|nr:endopeptidase La [Deltaproteobacteria bacterium]